MNTSYTKRHRIQEANVRLEKRFLMEETEQEVKSDLEKNGLGCITNGKFMSEDGGDGYILNVNGVEYKLYKGTTEFGGWAYTTKDIGQTKPFWYKCENNKPVVLPACDSKSQEFSGKQNDPWEYKILTDISNALGNRYCTRKKGTQNWIYIDAPTQKHNKAHQAIDKLYTSQKNNTQTNNQ